MTYKKYGKAFRTIRNQRAFKLTSFENVGISKSALSKFERGQSMLKFDKLILALNELSVTLAEYEQYLNDFQLNAHEQLLQNIAQSLYMDSKNYFPQYRIEALRLNEIQLAIALKSTYSSVTLLEIELLLEHFETLRFWRYTDFYILYLSLDFFDVKSITYIIEGILFSNHPAFESLTYRICFYLVAYRAIAILISRNRKDTAQYIFNSIDNSSYPHTMFTSNLRKLSNGLFIAKFENKNDGILQMQEAFDNIQYLHGTALSNYYRQMYTTYLQK